MRPSPNAVAESCEKCLEEIGFKRSKAGPLFIEIGGEFLGWVGLNRGTHRDLIRINPFIGLHVVPVEEMKNLFHRKKYRKGANATTSIHLGEIAPDVLAFTFMSEKDLIPESKRLAETIAIHAVPWFFEHANYPWLISRLESNLPMLGGMPEAYAAARYLNGDVEGAISYVKYAMHEFSNDGKGYDQYFAPFAKGLLALAADGEVRH
jgi:hypothetical protein